MGVINLDNPCGSPCIQCSFRCGGGVQEIEFCSLVLGWVVPKLKQGEIAPLQDPTSEHFGLRAGSGLKAENPIDVGVRDGPSTGPRVEKVPKMAGDVPVRYAPDEAGPGPVRRRGQYAKSRRLETSVVGRSVAGRPRQPGPPVGPAGQLAKVYVGPVPAPVMAESAVAVHHLVPRRTGLGIAGRRYTPESVNNPGPRRNRL